MNHDHAAFAKPATLYPDGSAYEFSQDGLSARQYAAIHLRVPDSGEEWLDNMIEKSLRNEFAARVIGELVVDPNTGIDGEAYVKFGYKIADLMLKESK